MPVPAPADDAFDHDEAVPACAAGDWRTLQRIPWREVVWLLGAGLRAEPGQFIGRAVKVHT